MESLIKRKTVLALTSALLLAGGAITSAYAHDERDDYDREGNPWSSVTGDLDCDGVYDRNDRRVWRDAHDADCDGVANRFDRHYDRRYNARWISGPGHHSRWRVGAYLPRDYYGSAYYVDYEPYGLARPPYGYRWNRVGDDLYLVSIRNGLIVRVEYDAFH